MDDRPHVSPGFKFNDWEMRGVPIRLELGPRDLAAGTALMSRRLNYQQPDAGKEAIPLGSAAERLAAELAAFQAMLSRRAADFRDEHTVTVNSWPEFTAAVATGWALALHCGEAGLRGRDQGRDHRHAAVHPAGRRTRAGHVRLLRQGVRLRQAGDLRPRLLSLAGAAARNVSQRLVSAAQWRDRASGMRSGRMTAWISGCAAGCTS